MLKDFITTEQFMEVMGGMEVVNEDKRLSDMFWQSKLVLDNKILLQDFIYILQFTDTVEQQQTQLSRVKRYIKKLRAKQKRDDLQQ
jgi:hypothetical protein|mmetsp:Transcript_18738/g.25356  ORF Transcript_18738/g.25356 Transcript_18738/m.25356 type:complete len:86 (-) Transcript_18738:1943-2200(-)